MSINIPQAVDRLRYRYPSLLVDAITAHEPGKRLVAVKNVTVNEDFFQGHFPGAPMMPGVLMIETLAQVATILLVGAEAPTTARPILRGVDNAKFRRQVVPGDRVHLEVTMGRRRSRIVRTRGVAYVGDQVVAEADLVLALEALHATIHPLALVHPDAMIGEGTVVGPYAVIGPRVRIGRRCRIDASSVIDG